MADNKSQVTIENPGKVRICFGQVDSTTEGLFVHGIPSIAADSLSKYR
jgi:hypothetical protein